MGGNKTKLMCSGIGCDKHLEVTYIYKFDGIHKDAAELSRWWYKRKVNVNTYLACENCISKVPNKEDFLHVTNPQMLLLMIKV